MKKMIIISGGFVDDKRVDIFDVALNEFRTAPPLNYGRWEHSTCCQSEKVFVVGGLGIRSQIMPIESLNIYTDQAWSVIAESCELLRREKSAITAVNDTHIVIFGGKRDQKLLNDGVVLDTRNGTLKPILGS